ncbi:hypothetical protein B4U80_13430 [Leptotrombidium deliense]|uniref:CCHC-type domain-containing protein n=1 Tax=Leptotrombidium deliense TaxID=299467 RepID=A0A443S6N1_9ACAR|nr:hypothetical protein B4U80_13430 [Leptotrombidium deliense]
MRIQETNESVINYVLAKKAMCYRVDPNMKEDEIISSIIEGINFEIAKILYVANPASVDELLKIAKNAEHGIKRVKDRSPNTYCVNENEDLRSIIHSLSERFDSLVDSEARVNYVSENKKIRYSNRYNNVKCFNCGDYGPYTRNCEFRLRERHWSPALNDDDQKKNCRSKYETSQRLNYHKRYMIQQAYCNHSLRNEDRSPETEMRNMPLKQKENIAIVNYNQHLFSAYLRIENIMLNCAIDTNARVTLITEDIAKKTNKDIIPYTGRHVNSHAVNNFNIVGEIELIINLDEEKRNSVVVYALVVRDSNFDIVLGNDFNNKAKTIVDFVTNSKI